MKIGVRIKWQLLRTRLYLQHLTPKAFALPLSIFVLTTAALIFYYGLFRFTDFWQPWSPAGGNAFHFCESNRMDQLIRQPSNTWSNLGYLLVALFMLTMWVNDLKQTERKASDNFLVRYPIFSLTFGLSALYLFIGSFLFHASLSRFFQKMDQTGVYSIAIIILAFNLYKIFPVFRFKGQWKSSHTLMTLLALVLNFLIFEKLWLININILFPAIMSLVFLTSSYYLLFVSREHYFTNYLWAALCVLLLATVIWILDRTNVACNPESMFQGHALWHLLTAASIFFIYLYYRSGTVPISQTIAVREERRRARNGF